MPKAAAKSGEWTGVDNVDAATALPAPGVMLPMKAAACTVDAAASLFVCPVADDAVVACDAPVSASTPANNGPAGASTLGSARASLPALASAAASAARGSVAVPVVASCGELASNGGAVARAPKTSLAVAALPGAAAPLSPACTCVLGATSGRALASAPVIRLASGVTVGASLLSLSFACVPSADASANGAGACADCGAWREAPPSRALACVASRCGAAESGDSAGLLSPASAGAGRASAFSAGVLGVAGAAGVAAARRFCRSISAKGCAVAVACGVRSGGVGVGAGTGALATAAGRIALSITAARSEGALRVRGSVAQPGDARGMFVALFLFEPHGDVMTFLEATLEQLFQRRGADVVAAHDRRGALHLRRRVLGKALLLLDGLRQAQHETLVAADELDLAFATELGAPALFVFAPVDDELLGLRLGGAARRLELQLLGECLVALALGLGEEDVE